MLRTSVSGTRLDILEWLKDPAAHFPPLSPGSGAERGVTVDAVAAKLGVPSAVAGTHLALLADMGLLTSCSIGTRTYYRRDEVRIAEVARMFEKGW
ncbi:ArsR/SmtB family transcription factor [Streptomyces sp. NPDC057257]|uniref:ArsR/SmtB family transcription factor n=1 Tax=Streptomyces sp. NPDC057257 TaxID=3346071 RepID=UPI003644F354